MALRIIRRARKEGLYPYDPGFKARMDKAAHIIGRYGDTLRVLARSPADG